MRMARCVRSESVAVWRGRPRKSASYLVRNESKKRQRADRWKQSTRQDAHERRDYRAYRRSRQPRQRAVSSDRAVCPGRSCAPRRRMWRLHRDQVGIGAVLPRLRGGASLCAPVGSGLMARIRSIKPEFWVSEQIAECSPSARLTFVGLWNFSDDKGVHPAKPKTLKAELYPMDDFSAVDVADWIAELIGAGLVATFESGGEKYWHVTGWEKHQKIDRPSFKHPAPPASNSASTRR